MEMVSPRLIPSVNGKAPSSVKGKRKSKRAMSARQVNKLALAITLAMGMGIPLLSLALSHVGGALLQNGQWILGICSLALCISVLIVSLSHLAWAIGNITHSPRAASWFLAVAVDASLVLSELVAVQGTPVGLESIRIALVVSVTLASITLNCWAFVRGK